MEQWVQDLAKAAEGSLRPVDGRVEIPGLGGEVEVLTDGWGIPHVYARNIEDLYAAQGWLHATERLFEVDFTRRLAQGRLAELVGEPGLPLDRFFRTVGLGRTARAHARRTPPEDRAILEPYLRGFRAGAAGAPPVEYLLLGAQPEFAPDFEEGATDANSIAMFMAFILSTNWTFELVRAWLARRLGPELSRELSPYSAFEGPLAVPASPSFPGVVRDLTEAAIDGGRAPGTGSNNWVVSGAKSATGAPLLANDPHLIARMPSIWYEVHLSCPEMEVTGMSVPGAPGVVVGHNRRVAWGFTALTADVEDLYLERLSPDGKRYLFKGKWHPVRTTKEKIRVRGEDRPRVHEVRATRHGPLLTDYVAGVADPTVQPGAIADPLALRWVHFDAIATVSQIQAIDRAETWGEFRAAVARWGGPPLNMVYADVDGNIGYQCVAILPVRARGPGASPLPGWTGEHEWRGTVPFEELPSVVNPPHGFLATANHRVVDADYPHYVTNDWEFGHRIRRITSLLAEKEKLSHEDFGRIHTDTLSGIAEELVPLFLGAHTDDERALHALKIVEAWDRRLDADAVGGAIFNAWLSRVSEALFREKMGDELFDAYHRLKFITLSWVYDAMREILRAPRALWVGGDGSDNTRARDALLGRALEDACADLEALLGPDLGDWGWGRMHTIHFRHPIASAIPALDELLSAGPYEAPGGDDTVNRGGFAPGESYADGCIPSCRIIVDLGDFDRSLAILPPGQAGNPASPHHHDQAAMWLRGEYRPMLWSRGAVQKESEGRLVLAPA